MRSKGLLLRRFRAGSTDSLTLKGATAAETRQAPAGHRSRGAGAIARLIIRRNRAHRTIAHRGLPRRLAAILAALATLAVLLGAGMPSEANNVSYTYDAGGRLLAAYDGNGNVANYQYDQLGNLTAIVKSSASSVLVFGYSPDNAISIVVSNITIYGNNFSATASQNTVTIGGKSATIVSSTTTQIVATLPSGISLPAAITVTSPAGTGTGPDLYSRLIIIN
jgi:YD repeat-containing protein